MKDIIHDIAIKVDDLSDKTQESYYNTFGYSQPVRVNIYNGYVSTADGGTVVVRGRVLSNEVIKGTNKDVSVLTNAKRMARRFLTKEVPGAKIRLHINEFTTQDIVCDEEGYFMFNQAIDGVSAKDGLWQDIHAELVEPIPEGQTELLFRGKIQSSQATLGVISDVDDTIIHSGATSTISLFVTTFSKDETDRKVFDGLSLFYQALHQSPATDAKVPFWYVSSSPWNMYDYFEGVWAQNDLPLGTFMLRDLGISESKFIKSSHGDHKLGAIEEVLNNAPHTTFLLIGDTGQRDPNIYREIALKYPERIAAVYLRDVQDGKRDAELNQFAQDLREVGVPMMWSADLYNCIEHCAEQGWIRQESATHIEQRMQEAIAQKKRKQASRGYGLIGPSYEAKRNMGIALGALALGGLLVWGVKRRRSER